MIAETPLGRIREVLDTVVACGACESCAELARLALVELGAVAEERDALAEALRYYTKATIVQSWGMQELADDGDLARRALSLPGHETYCGWPNAECICGWPEPRTLTVVRDEMAAACRQAFLIWHDGLNAGEALYQRVSQRPEPWSGDWRCEFSVWDGAQSYGWWGYMAARAIHPDDRDVINGWHCAQWDEGDSLLSEDDAWEPKP